MTKGKIILSVAALGATVAGALAFKPANNRHKLFISFTTAFGGKKCVQCQAWTLAGTSPRITYPSCATSVGLNKVAIPGGLNHRTLYTQKTVNGKCKTPNARYTLIN